MIGRHWAWLGLLAALLAAGTGVRAEAVRRIVAIGDLHGDFAAWRAIAQAAGLIDARGRWAGGETVLVQTGDVVDRGPESRRLILELMRLQREAPRAGGRVVALVGNHEAMNVTGDLRYAVAADYAAFADRDSARRRDAASHANRAAIAAAYARRDPPLTGEAARQAWLAETPLGFVEHRAAWSPRGAIGRWVTGNPAVLRLDGTLFVHGGIGPAYARHSIDAINRAVADALARREGDPASIVNDPAGPLWYRGLAAAGGAALAAELDAMLQAQGARRIVIGHTPVRGGIAVSESGRLVRIDTGIAAAVGGQPGYLEILGERLVPHRVARP